jgi:hypothetical protein
MDATSDAFEYYMDCCTIRPIRTLLLLPWRNHSPPEPSATVSQSVSQYREESYRAYSASSKDFRKYEC